MELFTEIGTIKGGKDLRFKINSIWNILRVTQAKIHFARDVGAQKMRLDSKNFVN